MPKRCQSQAGEGAARTSPQRRTDDPQAHDTAPTSGVLREEQTETTSRYSRRGLLEKAGEANKGVVRVGGGESPCKVLAQSSQKPVWRLLRTLNTRHLRPGSPAPGQPPKEGKAGAHTDVTSQCSRQRQHQHQYPKATTQVSVTR